MNLFCAICLFQEEYDPTPAITVMNGQAVCGIHWRDVGRSQTMNAGQLAILTVANPYAN